MKLALILSVFYSFTTGIAQTIPGHTMDQGKMKVELIVVFKKGITPVTAQKSLTDLKVQFTKSKDQSRGKAYYAANGPYYLVTTTVAEARAVEAKLSALKGVREVYPADWNGSR